MSRRNKTIRDFVPRSTCVPFSTYSVSFYSDLGWVFGDDLRYAFVLDDQSVHAHILSIIQNLGWLLEFATVISPDHDSEDVIGIWLVEIQEGRLAFALFCIFRANDFTAYGLGLAEEFGAFFRRDGLLILGVAKNGQESDEQRQCKDGTKPFLHSDVSFGMRLFDTLGPTELNALTLEDLRLAVNGKMNCMIDPGGSASPRLSMVGCDFRMWGG